MNLMDFINKNFDGNQSRFAYCAGVDRQTVRKWIIAGWIVVDGHLYSPRREVNRPEGYQDGVGEGGDSVRA